MRRWLAFACLAAVISGCLFDSNSGSESASETLASQPAAIDTPEAPDVSDVTYVQWRDTGLTVIKSATADELFNSVATCTSHEAGYTVQYPARWHTNDGGEAPGCSWFGPEPFAHAATLVAARRPLDIPIQIGVSRRGLAQVGGGPPPPLDDQVVIGGVEGHRTEAEIQAAPPWWSYAYNASLDPTFDGLTFMAQTTSAWEDEWRGYVLNKAILDRMMATLEFTAGVPAPVAAPTPGPDYVARAGYPFTVIDNAEADALFDTPDTCTNPVAGYAVTYPDDWYTNTEIGGWPACTWFSPTFYEVSDDPNEVPPQVAIVLVFADISYGYVGSPDFTHSQEVSVAGFGGYRAEQVGETRENGAYESQPPTYFYTVYLGDRPHTQPTLRATTNFEGAADYVLNKAVLDRIMALIEFDEAP